MINMQLAHVSSSGSASIVLDGPQKELTELLSDVYSAFTFKPNLKIILDREQVGHIKDLLQEVYQASAKGAGK